MVLITVKELMKVKLTTEKSGVIKDLLGKLVNHFLHLDP